MRIYFFSLVASTTALRELGVRCFFFFLWRIDSCDLLSLRYELPISELFLATLAFWCVQKDLADQSGKSQIRKSRAMSIESSTYPRRSLARARQNRCSASQHILYPPCPYTLPNGHISSKVERANRRSESGYILRTIIGQVGTIAFVISFEGSNCDS